MIKKQKVLFLDIDGPMIPGRSYTMEGQTKPLVKTFDPCAVGLINDLCKCSGWRIVIHSSWLKILGEHETVYHCQTQGLKGDYFHDDPFCKESINWRYTRVAEWLSRHPDTTHYVILDDDLYRYDMSYEGVVHPHDMAKHLLLIDFEEGILSSTMRKIRGGDWRVQGN